MPTGIYKRIKKWKLSEETKKKISLSKKGKKSNRIYTPHTEETKEKISKSKIGSTPWNKGKKGVMPIAWNKGLKMSKEHCEKLSKAHRGQISWNKGKKLPQNSGENNINWKGDVVGYRSLHTWVIRHLGQPDKCEDCGKDNLSGHLIHWANISGKYKRNLTDWKRLCVKCHSKFDKKIIKYGNTKN